MAFFNNKRKDFSIQPPTQSIANGAFTVTDSPNIDFTYALNNLTADLTLTGVTAGTYGDATNVASVTVDIFGRITGVTLIPISGGGITNANNGLINNLGIVQLGGATLGTGNLIRNSYITNDGFALRIDQTTGIALDLRTTTGTGLQAITNSGFAVRSRSNSGITIEALSFDDYSLFLQRETAGVSDVVGLIKAQRNTTGTAFNGLGGAFEIWIEHRNTIPAPSPTVPTATFEGIWANAGPLVANRVGKFRIRLDEADVQKDILSGLATGEVYCDRYGSGTFTGTATHYAAWDANGKLIEEPIPGGGSSEGSFGVTYDGNGGVISNGKIAYVQIPYNGTITGWVIGAKESGSCTIKVFKDTYANFPPTTPTDDIFTTAPSLSSQQKNQDLAPSFIGAGATVTIGDWIGFEISSVVTITWLNLTILITKT